jgi:hypothetical protein
MLNSKHRERYARFDQILQSIAEGQQVLKEQVESFKNENVARRRQWEERSLSTDERIAELLRAIAKLKKRRQN